MAKNVIINKTVYSNVPYIDAPLSTGGGDARFYDTGSATLSSGDLLTGKVAFGASGEVSGNMANNGATGGTISAKAGTVTIPAGYTTGGSVKISDAEQAKIIASNIRESVSILGVTGSFSAPTVSQNTQTGGLTIS